MGRTEYASVALAARAWLSRYPAPQRRRIPRALDLALDPTFAVVLALLFAAGIGWAILAPGMWPLMPLWALIVTAIWTRRNR